MIFVTLFGLPSVLTYADKLKKLVRQTIPSAISGVKELGIEPSDVTVFAPADLVQWGRGAVVRCVIEAEEIADAYKTQLLDAVHIVVLEFCKQRITSDPITEQESCWLIVEFRPMCWNRDGFRESVVSRSN